MSTIVLEQNSFTLQWKMVSVLWCSSVFILRWDSFHVVEYEQAVDCDSPLGMLRADKWRHLLCRHLLRIANLADNYLKNMAPEKNGCLNFNHTSGVFYSAILCLHCIQAKKCCCDKDRGREQHKLLVCRLPSFHSTRDFRSDPCDQWSSTSRLLVFTNQPALSVMP